MRPLEPAEVAWVGIIAAGVSASAHCIARGHRPLTAVANDHPFTLLYFLGHFLGIWPKYLDPISQAHRILLARPPHRR